MGKWLMIIGLVALILGVLVHYFPSVFNWFGKLPGDIHSETERGVIFIPITSMVIISILLTVLFNLFKH